MAEAGGRRRRCGGCLGLALVLDGAGLALLVAGGTTAAPFADLLLYAGGVSVLGSLLGWVSWCAGNLEVPPAELCDDVGLTGRAGPRKAAGAGRLVGLVRALSRRFSTAPGGGERHGGSKGTAA